MTQASARNTFKKHERLCSKKEIERLFAEGKAVNTPPLRLLYIPREMAPTVPVQIMFIVPKRSFRRAHDRNRIRRRMREAYRLQKIPFTEAIKTLNVRLSIAILFTGKKEEEYPIIHASMERVLSLLEKRL